MATGTDKKKINRALKRLIEKGMLTEENAHFQRRQTASASSNPSGAAASAPQSLPEPPAASVVHAETWDKDQVTTDAAAALGMTPAQARAATEWFTGQLNRRAVPPGAPSAPPEGPRCPVSAIRRAEMPRQCRQRGRDAPSVP